MRGSVSESEVSTLLRFRLYEVSNLQIRKMCEQADLYVSRLTRVAIGDISIGDLKPGKYIHLTPAQVDYLSNNVGKSDKDE